MVFDCKTKPAPGIGSTSDEDITTDLIYKIKGRGGSINWKYAHNYYIYKCKWLLKENSKKQIFYRTN